MSWLVGICFVLLVISWLASELVVVEEKGSGLRSFLKSFRRTLIFVVPLFAVAGVIYYGVFN